MLDLWCHSGSRSCAYACAYSRARARPSGHLPRKQLAGCSPCRLARRRQVVEGADGRPGAGSRGSCARGRTCCCGAARFMLGLGLPALPEDRLGRGGGCRASNDWHRHRGRRVGRRTTVTVVVYQRHGAPRAGGHVMQNASGRPAAGATEATLAGPARVWQPGSVTLLAASREQNRVCVSTTRSRLPDCVDKAIAPLGRLFAV